MANAIDARIECKCDGCGKLAEHLNTAPAPEGWFYIPVMSPDGDEDCALACSVGCCVPWKLYEPKREGV